MIQKLTRATSVYINVKVVPGVCSVQLSCSKAGLAMDDSLLTTFHRSDPINNEEELLRVVKEGRRNVIMLPKSWGFMPKDIANFLIDNGVAKNLEVTVHENLTLGEEIVHICKLNDLLNTGHSDLSVINIKKRRAYSNDKKTSGSNTRYMLNKS